MSGADWLLAITVALVIVLVWACARGRGHGHGGHKHDNAPPPEDPGRWLCKSCGDPVPYGGRCMFCNGTPRPGPWGFAAPQPGERLPGCTCRSFTNGVCNVCVEYKKRVAEVPTLHGVPGCECRSFLADEVCKGSLGYRRERMRCALGPAGLWPRGPARVRRPPTCACVEGGPFCDECRSVRPSGCECEVGAYFLCGACLAAPTRDPPRTVPS